MTETLTDRYRPEKFSDIQGNNSVLDDVKEWADNWAPGDDPLLFVGPPGVGKTSTAECIANRLGVQTVEVNASSARNTDDLRDLADQINALGEDGHRLVIVDEVDSWHHAARKRVLYDALDGPANPVVMTANDEYDVAGGLKSRATVKEFKLQKRSRRAKLNDIAEAEGLDLEDHELDTLADRPDLRSAINDLHRFADDTTVSGDSREWEADEWSMLDRVMTGTPDIGNMTPEDAMLWLDESVSAEYRGLEMAMAYEALSLADLELRQARETSYKHWKYASAIIETVADIRTTEPYFGDEVSYNNKSFPEWFRHSKPKATGDSPEARLYQALKKPDEPGMEFSGNYEMFLETYLPILKDLDTERKYELIQSYRLTPQEYKVLGVSESDYEEWREVEAPERGEWGGKVQTGDQW